MSRRTGFGRRHLIIALVATVVVLGALVATTGRWDPSTAPGNSSLTRTDETMVARVVEVVERGAVDPDGAGPRPHDQLRLRIENGSWAGQEVVVEGGSLFASGEVRPFERGHRVYIERMSGLHGDDFYISDLVRTRPLLIIGGLFVALILLTGRWKGLRALLGTLCSLGVIFAFIVPQIMAGRDPVVVSIAGSVALLAATNYLVYGWNPKAHAAMAGMALSLLLTGTLAWLFVSWTRLTGLSLDEGTLLFTQLGPELKLHKLVLAGIIIGSLGVLDDICVGQASAVFELARANRDLGWRDLFRHSLSIGQDHIAATVNTLPLAYMGASLPLLLVFTLYQEPLLRRLSREPISAEIIRALVGSVGLTLAMPITSLIASLLAQRMARQEGATGGEWAKA